MSILKGIRLGRLNRLAVYSNISRCAVFNSKCLVCGAGVRRSTAGNLDSAVCRNCAYSISERGVRIAVYLSNNIRVGQCESERAETVGGKRNLAGSCIGSCNIQVSTIIVVDINLLTLESIRQSYLNLSRTNLCILCRFRVTFFSSVPVFATAIRSYFGTMSIETVSLVVSYAVTVTSR